MRRETLLDHNDEVAFWGQVPDSAEPQGIVDKMIHANHVYHTLRKQAEALCWATPAGTA